MHRCRMVHEAWAWRTKNEKVLFCNIVIPRLSLFYVYLCLFNMRIIKWRYICLFFSTHVFVLFNTRVRFTQQTCSFFWTHVFIFRTHVFIFSRHVFISLNTRVHFTQHTCLFSEHTCLFFQDTCFFCSTHVFVHKKTLVWKAKQASSKSPSSLTLCKYNENLPQTQMRF